MFSKIQAFERKCRQLDFTLIKEEEKSFPISSEHSFEWQTKRKFTCSFCWFYKLSHPASEKTARKADVSIFCWSLEAFN